jgi:hypothetical protein
MRASVFVAAVFAGVSLGGCQLAVEFDRSRLDEAPTTEALDAAVSADAALGDADADTDAGPGAGDANTPAGGDAAPEPDDADANPWEDAGG